MKKATIISTLFFLFIGFESRAQRPTELPTASVDTVLQKAASPVKPAKISHAEPLYLDLVRDLGARKGEREWNVGTEFSQHNGTTNWHPFIEYEFAPINRLGLEVEIPLQLEFPASEAATEKPHHFHMHSVKTSIQWTYAVIERWKTSLAVGYTNELMVNSASATPGKAVFSAERGHPFLVAAKRWGSQWHSLVYASLAGEKRRGESLQSKGYEVNVAVHYVIPRSKAFVGVELYQFRQGATVEQVVRPQVRFALKSNLLVGLVGNIPLRTTDPVSGFLRIIYEPKRR